MAIHPYIRKRRRYFSQNPPEMPERLTFTMRSSYEDGYWNLTLRGGYMDSLRSARNVRGPRALKTPGIDSPQFLDRLLKKNHRKIIIFSGRKNIWSEKYEKFRNLQKNIKFSVGRDFFFKIFPSVKNQLFWRKFENFENFHIFHFKYFFRPEKNIIFRWFFLKSI